LEAREAVVRHVLDSMADCVHAKDMICSTKVLLRTCHIPERLFIGWNYRLLSVADVRSDENLEKMELKEKIELTLEKMFGLGFEFTKLPKRLKTQALDQLTVKYQQFLLSQNMISSLLESKELLSSEEFIDKNSTPLHEAPESELVWPAVENLPRL
jgi:hypothetical protein